jgi:hypothetical protein
LWGVLDFGVLAQIADEDHFVDAFSCHDAAPSAPFSDQHSTEGWSTQGLNSGRVMEGLNAQYTRIEDHSHWVKANSAATQWAIGVVGTHLSWFHNLPLKIDYSASPAFLRPEFMGNSHPSRRSCAAWSVRPPV